MRGNLSKVGEILSLLSPGEKAKVCPTPTSCGLLYYQRSQFLLILGPPSKTPTAAIISAYSLAHSRVSLFEDFHFIPNLGLTQDVRSLSVLVTNIGVEIPSREVDSNDSLTGVLTQGRLIH